MFVFWKFWKFRFFFSFAFACSIGNNPQNNTQKTEGQLFYFRSPARTLADPRWATELLDCGGKVCVYLCVRK